MKRIYSFLALAATVVLAIALCFVLSSCGCSHANREWRLDYEPTYTTEGQSKQICLDCGMQTSTYELQSFSRNIYTHYYDEIVIKEPTCTEIGRKKFIYRSYDFEAVFESDVPTIAHTYDEENGTAKDENYHYVYCSCGASTEIEHKKLYIDFVQSTCSVAGSYRLCCSYCDLDIPKTMNLFEHKYENREAVEATCQSGGNTAGKECTVCGDRVDYEPLPIVNCSYTDGFCKWCDAKLIYRVTYVNDDSRETVELEHGSRFDDRILPNELHRAFLGWYNEDGTVKYNSQSQIEINMTVYAKWEDAIAVSTAEDFIAIAQSPSRSFYLTNDINLKGAMLLPIGNFTGTLNGCGYTVKNFNVNTTSLSDYQGLFRINNGRISDIIFSDYTFNINIANAQKVLYGAAVGSIVGLNKGTLYNIELYSSSINTSITVSMPKGSTHSILIHIGGIVGINEGRIEKLELDYANNVILNLYNGSFGISGDACDIEMYFNVGKTCGYNKGDIEGVLSTGLFSIDAELGREQHDLETNCYIGGMIGKNEGKVLRSSYEGDITYSKDSSLIWLEREYAVIGGFVGLNYGEVSESFAITSINGGCENGYKVGGFVGLNERTAKIASCYADSEIILLTEGSNYAGGFAGVNNAIVQSSYSAGAIDCRVNATVGGFVGLNDTGGTVNRSYSKTAVAATAGTAGRFAGANRAIISKAYWVDGYAYTPGTSVEGTMSITTDIKFITTDTLLSEVFLCDVVYWNEEGWQVVEGKEPVLLWTLD